MVFFDSENRNIKEVSGLAVESVLIENGVNSIIEKYI
jgi:hypothetical protein